MHNIPEQCQTKNDKGCKGKERQIQQRSATAIRAVDEWDGVASWKPYRQARFAKHALPPSHPRRTIPNLRPSRGRLVASGHCSQAGAVSAQHQPQVEPQPRCRPLSDAGGGPSSHGSQPQSAANARRRPSALGAAHSQAMAQTARGARATRNYPQSGLDRSAPRHR